MDPLPIPNFTLAPSSSANQNSPDSFGDFAVDFGDTITGRGAGVAPPVLSGIVRDIATGVAVFFLARYLAKALK